VSSTWCRRNIRISNALKIPEHGSSITKQLEKEEQKAQNQMASQDYYIKHLEKS